MTLYTVWHQIVHVIKENTTREGPWLQENVTGFMYRKELAVGRSYMFAVTAWNKWGESILESDKIFVVSTNFTDGITQSTDKTAIKTGKNC